MDPFIKLNSVTNFMTNLIVAGYDMDDLEVIYGQALTEIKARVAKAKASKSF